MHREEKNPHNVGMLHALCHLRRSADLAQFSIIIIIVMPDPQCHDRPLSPPQPSPSSTGPTGSTVSQGPDRRHGSIAYHVHRYMTYGHHKSETDLSVHRIDQALMLYVPLFTFVLGLLLCSINLSLSIAGHYQSPSSLISPLLPHRCRTSSSLSLSSFADCYSPLTSNHADVTSAPWCVPQVCATIAPVSRVSCTSCSTPRSSSLARRHMFFWTFSCFRIYSLAICMFSPFFLYLRPVAPFFSFHIVSFAIGVRPLLLLSPLHLLSHFNIIFILCF